MRGFGRDLRQGLRQLMRRPAFSLAAVGSLALGIGLTTTLFSVVHAVLLRDTPVREPERLVEIYSGFNEFPQLVTSYPDYLDIASTVDAFEAVIGHGFVGAILATEGRGRLVTGEVVTANYFDVLGLAPRPGRGFRADEGASPGAAPVAVVSRELWRQQLGGRENLAGATIDLSGRAYTVVGVAPPGFHGTMPGIPTDFWVPVTMVEAFDYAGPQASLDNNATGTRLERRGLRWLFVKGRLAPGRSFEEARSQVEALFTRLRAEHPVTNKGVEPSVLPAVGIRFHPMLDGYVKAASAVLLVAVGLVLLVACANVASMLLARGTARRRELAIRAAIGADRRRLVRQLLSESLVLAAVGGGLGVLVAWWAGRLVSGFGTDVFPIPVDFQVAVDGTVLTFAVGISLVTALVFGLVPAWSASRVDLVPALSVTPAPAGGARRRLTFRDALVVGQLALSVVLLVAGALLTRGLLSARHTDIGFDPMPVSWLSFNLQMNGYDIDRATALRDRALEAVGVLPGVVAVSVATRLPFAPDINMDGILVPGHHQPGDDETPVDAVSVGADYFKVVGVPVVAGRAFTEDDLRHGRHVVIVNETLARRYWPEGAVGRQVHLSGFDAPASEIIGVARDHKVRSVGEEPRGYLHRPARPSRAVSLVVRTQAPAVTALPMLRQALWELEPNIVFTEDAPAEDIAATTTAPTRIGAAIMGGFGALALGLAAVGLYGVIAYSVSLRTREVGIRMALGASRGQVLGQVMAQGGRLAVAGLLVGGLASLGVGTVLASLLYGVGAFDAVAYTTAAGLLLVVAAAANFVPALGAARIDPLQALRRE